MNKGELKLFLGILAIAIALASVTLYPTFVSSRADNQTGPIVIKDPIKARVTRKDLFPEGAWYKGKKDAPILVVEFADYQCPMCATAVEQMKKILAKHPDEVCYVFHGIQIQATHRNALIMAQAAEAAGLQGKYWEMHEALFKKQRDFVTLPEVDAIDAVTEIAKSIGLDMMRFGADLRGSTATRAQERSGKIAIRAEVQSTPCFFILREDKSTLKLQSLRELVNWFDKLDKGQQAANKPAR
ncbi:MAG: thioredoxin domain-containing protein [Chthonomonadales bacterium]|nr:thioredoxin domain-containing protein [Chthonomonadales bacterium]